MSDDRTKTWAFLVYPDSAPNNWQSIIKSFLVKTAISPKHTPDPLGTDDELKEHWHVVLVFDSNKSYQQVADMIAPLNGTRPFKVNSTIGYIQYLIHKNDPDKEQFMWEDITCYNGLDLSKYQGYTEAQLDGIIADITQFIDENFITEYSDLIAFCRDRSNDVYESWYRVVRKNTMLFNAYLSSRRNQYKQNGREGNNTRSN